MTSNDTDPQTTVDDFNAEHGSVTWVRYWTGTRDDAPKYNLTDGKAWLLGGHTPVVRVRGESSCIALTHVDVIPGQPDDVEDDSHDLPEPGPAAARVVAYIAANGDGIYDLIDGHPLYARDLEALRRAGEEVEQLRAELNEALPQITAAWIALDKAGFQSPVAGIAELIDELAAALADAEGRGTALAALLTKSREQAAKVHEQNAAAQNALRSLGQAYADLKTDNDELAAENARLQPAVGASADRQCQYGYPLGGLHPRTDWCQLPAGHTGVHKSDRDPIGFTDAGTVKRQPAVAS